MSVDSMEESPEGDTEPFDRPTVPSPAYRGSRDPSKGVGAPPSVALSPRDTRLGWAAGARAETRGSTIAAAFHRLVHAMRSNQQPESPGG